VSEGSDDQVPAGWYPSPRGGQRYWDGKRWLALPEPDDTETTAGPEPVTSQPPVDYPIENVATGGQKKKIIIGSVAAVVILIAVAVGLILKSSHDTDVRNASISSSSSSSKAAAARAAADAAEADRQRDIAGKRAERASTVTEIADAVKTMAEKHVQDGLFDGPVLSVTCDPIGGGSTDDLSAKTTIFECFAAMKDNGDGTLSGRKYHATMNWDTGQYTYGLGPAS
jgi:hypothetical protein